MSHCRLYASIIFLLTTAYAIAAGTAPAPSNSNPVAATQPPGTPAAAVSVKPLNPDQITLRQQPPVFALLRPAYPPKKGAVILLHDEHQHADWPLVISPLRKTLPKYGWTTLSLMIPPQNADTDMLLNQVKSALAYCDQNKLTRIVLLIYGRVGKQIQPVLALTSKAKSSALILISVAWEDKLDDIQHIPVMDLVGSKDFLPVLRAAKHRRQWMLRHGIRRYRQTLLAGADHEYAGNQHNVIRQVRGWLETLTEQAKP